MARKKRRGVTLFELLRKDEGQPTGPIAKPQVSAPQQAEPTQTEVCATTDVAAPAEPKVACLQVDEEGYILHFSRRQMILSGAGAVVLLVVFLLIGSSMSRSSKDLQAGTHKQVDGELVEPLASLAPPAGSENGTPDSPVRLTKTAQVEATGASEAAEPEQDAGAGQAKPMAAAHVEQSTRTPTGASQGDTRKPGLNYLVIQIIPADAKPSAQEHATEVQKFLRSKGINTIAVPAAGGGIKIVSEQGFDSAEAADKDKCDKLIEKVRLAGKEYASAKYMGRYNFSSPYKEKYRK